VGLPLLYRKGQKITAEEMYIGIDVGKTWLDLAIWGVTETIRVTNDESGLEELLKFLEGKTPTLIVVEASGGYEQEVVQSLILREYKVAVVNPTRVRSLAKAMGLLAKTDVIDAHLISAYAYKIQPEPKVLQEEQELYLRGMVSRRAQLVEIRAAEHNRLGTSHKLMKADVKEHIEWLDNQINILDEEMKKLVSTLPNWNAQIQRLDTIPGVAFITAVTIAVEMPELGHLDRQKIAALAGLAPFNQDSGKKRGKRRIFGGRSEVRRVLYMACLSAIKHNSVIKKMYDRLILKGKVFKVAMTACMRKMLTIMNAMAREKTVWAPATN
jgi:transposase